VRLTFRQGIVRHQVDVASNPIFLQRSAGAGNTIDLIVSPTPTIVAFAHRSANYIIEEVRTVKSAWGPFSGTQTTYLYWDINMLTGVLTRGTTVAPPIYAGTPPANPIIDQHWFDTTETVMRVWNGAKWIEKIRVFAGFLRSGAVIVPYRAGISQAGIQGQFEGGNLVLDSYNKPLRQSDGSFVTTVTSMLIVNNASKKVRFEAAILSGMALEPIPKFSLVQMRPGRRLVLGRSNDNTTRIDGICLDDMGTNEVADITTEGLVRNESWSFSSSQVNRPIFCGTNGQVTTSPPTSGVSQIVGFVYDTDAVYMNIQSAIILDDLNTYEPPPPPPPPDSAPVPNFFGTPTAGPAPLLVNFTSTSVGATSYQWDFNDDDIVDSTSPAVSHIFATPGQYTIRLRAINIFGGVEEVKQNYITVSSPAQTGLFTNLGISLGAPNQVARNVDFNVQVMITNDGFLTATGVTRILTIPDVAEQRIQVIDSPAGSIISRSGPRTIVELPVVPTLSSGQSVGPVTIKLRSPTVSGSITVGAAVESPEVDSTIGDNNSSIQITVLQ